MVTGRCSESFNTMSMGLKLDNMVVSELVCGPVTPAMDFLGTIETYCGPGSYALSEIRATPGGSPINVAVGVRRLGASVSIFGTASASPMASICLESLSAEGVNIDLVQRKDDIDCYAAFVLVERNGGRRTIFANDRAPVPDFSVSEEVRRAVLRAKVYGGHSGILFSSEHNRNLICSLFSEASQSGVITYLDSSEERDHQRMDVLVEILPHIALFFPGRLEAEWLTGESRPSKAARYLLKFGPRCVTVKMGRYGCLVVTKSTAEYCPGLAVAERDLTGAGDAFLAGFLAGVLRGHSWGECGELGNAYAALNIMVMGPRQGLSSFESLRSFMGRQKSKNVWQEEL
jgi:sugar/nucleoside kinase (ribokinase family)